MTDFVFEEAFNLLCGAQLGQGIARQVFTCAYDETLVVKVERDPHRFQNVREYSFWQECQFYRKVADWLAPCVWISPRGAVMLQRRVEPVPKAQLPPQLPAWMRDIKPEHFGLFEGRLVCCDYALTNSTLPTKLKAAGWD